MALALRANPYDLDDTREQWVKRTLAERKNGFYQALPRDMPPSDLPAEVWRFFGSGDSNQPSAPRNSGASEYRGGIKKTGRR